jgi:CO/xanthine dehydrogenase Mo-binding subunit
MRYDPATMSPADRVEPPRRTFLRQAALATGAFVLAAYIPLPRRAIAAQEGGAIPQGIFDPNVFLKISSDDTVTLISKKFEMGQGVTTGFATLVAEELDADFSRMRFEFAPADARSWPPAARRRRGKVSSRCARSARPLARCSSPRRRSAGTCRRAKSR